MAEDFIVNAEFREQQGTGASRRLRREGLVPAILYGGHEDPRMLCVRENEMRKHLESEAFYSHILTIQVGSEKQQAVLKDVQRHPAKVRLLHIDFQRVTAGEAITMNVPLHFLNEETCKGVKTEGGIIDHRVIDVEISCLPKDLPEYIEVDVLELGLGDSVHLSEITVPEGVTISALSHGDDQVVASVIKPRVIVEEDEETAEGDAAEGDAEDAEGSDGDQDDES